MDGTRIRWYTIKYLIAKETDFAVDTSCELKWESTVFICQLIDISVHDDILVQFVVDRCSCFKHLILFSTTFFEKHITTLKMHFIRIVAISILMYSFTVAYTIISIDTPDGNSIDTDTLMGYFGSDMDETRIAVIRHEDDIDMVGKSHRFYFMSGERVQGT